MGCATSKAAAATEPTFYKDTPQTNKPSATEGMAVDAVAANETAQTAGIAATSADADTTEMVEAEKAEGADEPTPLQHIQTQLNCEHSMALSISGPAHVVCLRRGPQGDRLL